MLAFNLIPLLLVLSAALAFRPVFKLTRSALTSSALRMSDAATPSERNDLRNVAIIAHVDHGKTTLVDSMIRQSGAFRENQAIESMDNDAQERERGITILAKNAAVMYQGTKINLVDTPGHADFGGEVERIMNMVDAVLLVVDSVDGPKPQTRFVLKKALEKGLKAIVVIVYASGMNGIAGDTPSGLQDNLNPLFDAILKVEKAKVDMTKPLQLLIANIDYDDFKGKMGIGRIVNGKISTGDEIVYGKPGEENKKGKVGELFVFNNVGRESVTTAMAGDIVMITGIADVGIGMTVMDKDNSVPLPTIAVEEPTVRMTIGVNKSPLGGREGKLLQTRVIRDRLFKELDRNVALRVTETDSADTYEVCGRGQLHLTVLIENMRREGFELFVGPPTVIEKKVDGVMCEPFELIDVTVPNDFSSSVVDILMKRKGEMMLMGPVDGSEGLTALQFLVPTRGMIGIRNTLLTATKGTVILDTQFDSYRPSVGAIGSRERGSLLAFEQARRMFILPKEEVFKDMIIGVHQRPGDLHVNVCKTKALTNMRAAGSDDTTKITPPMELNLDIAVEYIGEDELVEVTPTKIRMLKHPDHKEWAKKRKDK
ncbi:P-loop containing nucleoside triphosphate hydrolase protein [Ochromonadaceae sp. CCMP2298]|nr:P-loop containing nucleoside triphosphate hydrolase protein [Ochromonadaceae sp. CCMP2298]